MKLDALTQAAIRHTMHCLLGCSIGEILGMVLSTALKWSNLANIVLSVCLAFLFGYLLTIRSLHKKNIKGKTAIRTAAATDTASIASMELIDNTFIFLVPGALSANLDSGLFWWSLSISLVVAFFLTVPVNRIMISKTNGHHH
jgi:uncharacterized membrane protein YbjE (DUF340 family)